MWEDWYTDDIIIDYVFKSQLYIFCKYHIHPNIITMIALVLSALMPYFHVKSFHWLVVSCIIIRQICDCLDGSVARECEKTSKLGGFLDTLADNIEIFSIIFIAMTFIFPNNYLKIFSVTSILILTFIIINLIIFDSKFIFDHKFIKEYSDSTYKNIIAFIANNSLLVHLGIALVYSNAILIMKIF